MADTPETPALDRYGITPDYDALYDALTGRSGGLRPSKPTTHDGLTQYVWRHAQFHSGRNTKMPVTAAWWLQDYLEEQDIDTDAVAVSGILTDEGKAVRRDLALVVDTVLDYFGLDNTKAARRWKQAGAF